MKFKRLIISILLINLIILPNMCQSTNAEDTIVEFTNSNSTSETTNVEILSDAAILIDSKTGTVLYSKNANKKMYPASTTKILTAILAIENSNLSDKAITSYKAISLIPAGYSSAYLSEGEEMSVEHLLEVLLVHSANDAANVLAEHVSGSIEKFVELMNEKLIELGCTDTHFVNTNGIHSDDHYTTASDMAKIFQYCIQNSTFREIISMKSCIIPATNKSKVRKYNNTNDLINPDYKYYLSSCVGGKTGYTSQAGNCLVSLCSKDDLELICVVLKASQLSSTISSRYSDSFNLYKYGYSNYSIEIIAHKDDVIDTIKVKHGSSKTKVLDLVLANDIYALVNTSQEDSGACSLVYINENISAPLAKDSVLGYVEYTVGSITYKSDLLASHNVEKSSFLLLVLRFALILIVFALLIVVLNKLSKKKKRYSRYKSNYF